MWRYGPHLQTGVTSVTKNQQDTWAGSEILPNPECDIEAGARVKTDLINRLLVTANQG